MSSDLDLVIKRLESELNNRNLKGPKNYVKQEMKNNLEENNGKESNIDALKIPLKSNIIYNKNIFQNEINQMKKQIEDDLFQYIFKLKSEMKKSLDEINIKMNIFKEELLKINIMNDNLRNTTGKLSELENNFNLHKKEYQLTSAMTIQNNENYEIININLKEKYEQNDKMINSLENYVKNLINQQKIFEEKYNDYYSKNINN